MRRISPGETDVTLYVFVPNSSQTDGRGLTGLAFNTASLACYYVRSKGSAAQITLATQTVTGAHSDGGFVEVDATNMPGVYRLDLPDAVVATGVDEAAIILRGAANMAPVTIGIDLRWQLGYVPWVEFTASGTPTTTTTDAALGTLSAGIAADLAGAMLVVQTGTRAGERVRVTSVSESGGTLTFTHEALSGAMAANDVFSVEHAKTQKSGTGAGEISLSAGIVSADVKKVNSVTIVGDGAGTPFGV